MGKGAALITGAAGFLGRELVRQYLTAGRHVCAVIRPGGSGLAAESPGLTVEAVDLLDAEGLRRVVARHRPTEVVHAAAAPGHARKPDEIRRSWELHVLGTVHLLAALQEAPDARLVHVGAGTEYAAGDGPLREDHPGLPPTARGASKLAATLAVRQWASADGRAAVVVRPFSIYGRGEQPTKLVPTLLRCAHTGDSFPMLDGVSRRDLVHVGDVAEGCRRAAAVAHPSAPVVNLGTGTEHTVDEVRRLVEEVTGRTIRVVPGARARQAHDIEHWVADTSRCQELLGWVPPTTLRDGLVAG